MHLLFTATCSRMNSPVNQTNCFFHGFLSNSMRSLRVYILKLVYLKGRNAAVGKEY